MKIRPNVMIINNINKMIKKANLSLNGNIINDYIKLFSTIHCKPLNVITDNVIIQLM
jgi:hypothetical protein